MENLILIVKGGIEYAGKDIRVSKIIEENEFWLDCAPRVKAHISTVQVQLFIVIVYVQSPQLGVTVYV